MKNYLSLSLCLFALLLACEPASDGSSELQSGPGQAEQGASKVAPLVDTVGTYLPGKSLGTITLGENSVSAFEGLDSLSFSESSTGHAVYAYVIDDNGKEATLDVFTTLDSNSMNIQRVTVIRTTAAKYKDERGLGVGSTVDELRSAYAIRPVAAYTGEEPRTLVYRGEEGISFELGGDSICRAVTIYGAGEQPSELYQALFSSYSPMIRK